MDILKTDYRNDKFISYFNNKKIKKDNSPFKILRKHKIKELIFHVINKVTIKYRLTIKYKRTLSIKKFGIELIIK